MAPFKAAYIQPFFPFGKLTHMDQSFGMKLKFTKAAKTNDNKDGFEQALPVCASNETYIEELRKLIQTRLTVADQETALKEVMMRNREEYLLKKKNTNVVDEMQLGLITLEKNFKVISELANTMLRQTIEEQQLRRGRTSLSSRNGKNQKHLLEQMRKYTEQDAEMAELEEDELTFK
jgi:hypothetical protein